MQFMTEISFTELTEMMFSVSSLWMNDQKTVI